MSSSTSVLISEKENEPDEKIDVFVDIFPVPIRSRLTRLLPVPSIFLTKPNVELYNRFAFSYIQSVPLAPNLAKFYTEPQLVPPRNPIKLFTIILDIDETLISTDENYAFYLRSGTRKLLKKIDSFRNSNDEKVVEVIFWSAGDLSHVINFLKILFNDSDPFYDFVISRGDWYSKEHMTPRKYLFSLFPNREGTTIIIDDMTIVSGLNGLAHICVTPFIKNPKRGTLSVCTTDNQLEMVGSVLNELFQLILTVNDFQQNWESKTRYEITCFLLWIKNSTAIEYDQFFSHIYNSKLLAWLFFSDEIIYDRKKEIIVKNYKTFYENRLDLIAENEETEEEWKHRVRKFFSFKYVKLEMFIPLLDFVHVECVSHMNFNFCVQKLDCSKVGTFEKWVAPAAVIEGVEKDCLSEDSCC